MAHHLPARQDIVDRLRATLPDILAGRPVFLAYLYGSVAEDCTLPGSDVDVALVLAPRHGLSAYQRMQLELGIAAEIEQCCGLPEVDVRSVSEAPIMVQGTVLRTGVLVYSRDEDFRADFETLTRKRYFDFLPIARRMQRAYFEHMGVELRRKGLLADGQPGYH
ncbi:MAG: nucleotidyltransferase domain-containing protein [Chloroflexi bacterium]|nr:nucleotidyltransferase domain-containing protein [Chloroflexota bacterium]MBU1750370.1 nucleotidyltransferase domain-containing protein [Chloroflexota bacterium]